MKKTDGMDKLVFAMLYEGFGLRDGWFWTQPEAWQKEIEAMLQQLQSLGGAFQSGVQQIQQKMLEHREVMQRFIPPCPVKSVCQFYLEDLCGVPVGQEGYLLKLYTERGKEMALVTFFHHVQPQRTSLSYLEPLDKPDDRAEDKLLWLLDNLEKGEYKLPKYLSKAEFVSLLQRALQDCQGREKVLPAK